MKIMAGLGIALFCLAASPALADGIGTTVSGSLNFNGFGTTNFFSTAAGFVPPGYSNSGGSTSVTIGSGIEFGFNDGDNLDTADFTGTTLSISDTSTIGGTNGFVMTFTDLEFASFAILSNDLGVSYTFSGNTLIVVLPSATFKSTTPETVTFSYTTAVPNSGVVPEPESLTLLATGLLSVIPALRRRMLST